MKKLFFLFFVLPLVVVAGEVTATSVTAQQRYPWNGLVDVVVTIQGDSNEVASADCLFAATNSATKIAIPVNHIMRNGGNLGSGATWTRRFIWDAKADVGTVEVDDVALTVDVKNFGGVQLWENGPYWADCNVGAMKPEEFGYYFWWGDTVGYKQNTNGDGWVSVKDSAGFAFVSESCPTYGSSNSQLQNQGYTDEMGNLAAAHDAATVHLGGPWRVPTGAEFSALISNCTTTFTMRNGVYGRLFTGKGVYASKSIFFPAAGNARGTRLDMSESLTCGCYWSSTAYTTNSYCSAHFFCFTWSTYSRMDYPLYYGMPIRPVRELAK